MKYQIILIAVFMFPLAVLCQSQTDLNLEAEKKFIEKDEELNTLYQKIIADYSNDKQFIKNLRASERLWVKFRDAEVLMKYPENIDLREGTVFNLCYYTYMTELTQSRINTLNKWIDGEPEGEVCSGSIDIQ